MIRRDFVKRLSALAALPILPAFLRRPEPPVYIGDANALIVRDDLGPYGEMLDGEWHRFTYASTPDDTILYTSDGKGVNLKYVMRNGEWVPTHA